MMEAKRPMEGTDMKKWLAALILVCLLTGCAAGAGGEKPAVYELSLIHI